MVADIGWATWRRDLGFFYQLGDEERIQDLSEAIGNLRYEACYRFRYGVGEVIGGYVSTRIGAGVVLYLLDFDYTSAV
jgi:hypothetical protein